jgi:Leucine-rich repeat (LRR) protein
LLLDTNQISDISPLAEHTNFRRLSVRENPLNEDAYNIYIPLIYENNPGIDIRYDSDNF